MQIRNWTASAVVLALSLTACAGGNVTAEADLAVAVTELPEITEGLHMDPSAGSLLFHNVYETLFEFDDREQRLRPMVATRYEYLEDNTVLELTIRDDVRFHDGTELTTQALAEQLVRMQDELGDALDVTEVEVVDAVRVRLHTAVPDLGLVGLFTTAPTALWLAASEQTAAPLGTGPYRVAAFEPGETLQIASVDDERFAPPRYETVAAEAVGGPMEQITAVAAGEADLAPRVGSAWAETVAATDRVHFHDPQGEQAPVDAAPTTDGDGLLDLDECGTRFFPTAEPFPNIGQVVFELPEPQDVPILVGPDDYESYTPFDGVDCNRFHAESGLEFLVVSEDLDWDAAALWRVDLRPHHSHHPHPG